MSDRHILLKNWIWAVFNENKEMTGKKLVAEFEKDVPLAMAGSLKDELELLKKEVKNV